MVEGGQAKEITNKAAVAKIKKQLAIRKKAGIELSKVIRSQGVTSCAMFNATNTIGD